MNAAMTKKKAPGILPHDQYLLTHGKEGLVEAMRTNPKSFAHLRQDPVPPAEKPAEAGYCLNVIFSELDKDTFNGKVAAEIIVANHGNVVGTVGEGTLRAAFPLRKHATECAKQLRAQGCRLSRIVKAVKP